MSSSVSLIMSAILKNTFKTASSARSAAVLGQHLARPRCINSQRAEPDRKHTPYYHLREGEGGMYTFPKQIQNIRDAYEEVNAIGTHGCRTCACVYVPLTPTMCFAAHIKAWTSVHGQDGRDTWCPGPEKGEALTQRIVEKLQDSEYANEKATGTYILDGVQQFFKLEEEVRQFDLAEDERAHGFGVDHMSNHRQLFFREKALTTQGWREKSPGEYGWGRTNPDLAGEENLQGRGGSCEGSQRRRRGIAYDSWPQASQHAIACVENRLSTSHVARLRMTFVRQLIEMERELFLMIDDHQIVQSTLYLSADHIVLRSSLNLMTRVAHQQKYTIAWVTTIEVLVSPEDAAEETQRKCMLLGRVSIVEHCPVETLGKTKISVQVCSDQGNDDSKVMPPECPASTSHEIPLGLKELRDDAVMEITESQSDIVLREVLLEQNRPMRLVSCSNDILFQLSTVETRPMHGGIKVEKWPRSCATAGACKPVVCGAAS
ncbi:hypothetical protein DOTSEDRAFT_83248 [Dothistroma septosporum NZE10]|uniref:Uncharacterized protein n=1 Tax=Dothistroma septosporum (strain NZE10 / CBS 128990) TaxID=675120 RepID=M2YKQ2_DOTSN|nr:hypothetical protein DOTSEDRAFT_83248 [Dothistroma septosporum NZE10]